MKAIECFATLACFVVANFGGSLSSLADGASVEWHNVSASNPTSPLPFAVSPNNPMPGDRIYFEAATDAKIHVNSCWASWVRGEPGISIDSTNRKVVVQFSDPRTNGLCPLILLPVMGIDGQFGPLAAGSWMFSLIQTNGTNSFTFNVGEIPGKLSIEAVAVDRYILSWPTNGGSFALEFNSDLSATNWESVVSGPILSSNRYMVEVFRGAESRFFRLRLVP